MSMDNRHFWPEHSLIFLMNTTCEIYIFSIHKNIFIKHPYAIYSYHS